MNTQVELMHIGKGPKGGRERDKRLGPLFLSSSIAHLQCEWKESQTRLKQTHTHTQVWVSERYFTTFYFYMLLAGKRGEANGSDNGDRRANKTKATAKRS